MYLFFARKASHHCRILHRSAAYLAPYLAAGRYVPNPNYTTPVYKVALAFSFRRGIGYQRDICQSLQGFLG